MSVIRVFIRRWKRRISLLKTKCACKINIPKFSILQPTLLSLYYKNTSLLTFEYHTMRRYIRYNLWRILFSAPSVLTRSKADRESICCLKHKVVYFGLCYLWNCHIEELVFTMSSLSTSF